MRVINDELSNAATNLLDVVFKDEPTNLHRLATLFRKGDEPGLRQHVARAIASSKNAVPAEVQEGVTTIVLLIDKYFIGKGATTSFALMGYMHATAVGLALGVDHYWRQISAKYPLPWLAK